MPRAIYKQRATPRAGVIPSQEVLVFNILLLTFALLGTPAPQADKRTCDHAAPPEGMHYVCSPTDSCDCRLERDSSPAGEPPRRAAAIPGPDPCSAAGLRYFVAPAYPAAARAARKQDTVSVRLTVDATGIPQVQITSGDPAFRLSVLAALNKWRFAPAEPPRALTARFTFAIAGDAGDPMRTTVAGSSPFDLVISASPPPR